VGVTDCVTTGDGGERCDMRGASAAARRAVADLVAGSTGNGDRGKSIPPFIVSRRRPGHGHFPDRAAGSSRYVERRGAARRPAYPSKRVSDPVMLACASNPRHRVPASVGAMRSAAGVSAKGRATSRACPAARRCRARGDRSRDPRPTPREPCPRTRRTSSCAARGSRPSALGAPPAIPARRRT